MSEAFALHPQLEKDSVQITDWTLCDVRLVNDRRFPWLLLVPRRANLRDLQDASEEDYALMMEEIRRASQMLKEETGAQKMNVASLGNMVPQLHIHIIARFKNDEAWPGPVWGVGTAEPYGVDARVSIVRRYKDVLSKGS